MLKFSVVQLHKTQTSLADASSIVKGSYCKATEEIRKKKRKTNLPYLKKSDPASRLLHWYPEEEETKHVT